MTELWQLYDEDGKPIAGKGATPNDVMTKGLLHGASHVWMWRIKDGVKQVLLQKRAATKRTYPNLYDISAAGHIDLDETPVTAAIRETSEEIGIDIAEDDLQFIHLDRRNVKVQNSDSIENEFNWVYVLELTNQSDFKLQESEVASLVWKNLDEFQSNISSDESVKDYVPHGSDYFEQVINGIKDA